MHVLIIPSWHDVDYSDDNHTFFHNFASYLSELKDVEVGMIYAELSLKPQYTEKFSFDELTYNYIGMKGMGFPKRSILWQTFYKKYVKLYDEYVLTYGAPELIHGHSVIGLIIARHLSLKRAVPFIYTEHLGELKKENYLRKELLVKATEAVGEARFCTTVSQGMCSTLSSLFNTDFTYIPNMIDTKLFSLKSLVVSDPIFIFVGEPVDVKGIDVMIQAWALVLKKIPDAKLLFLDEIRDKYKIEPAIDQLDLGHSISFLGVVSPEKVAEFLRNSAVFISASRYESFGMSIAESASCGTPVVATKTDGASSIVVDSIGELVEREDEIALADKILEVFNNRMNYEPEKMHAHIKDQFGKEIISRKWSELYQKAILQIL